jgi:hypothetical protein
MHDRFTKLTAGFGINPDAVATWAKRRGCHDANNTDGFLMLGEELGKTGVDVIAIDYPQVGPDRKCLILLVTHQGSFGGLLGSHGGFAKNSEGQFIRNEDISENLAKEWLSREGFQESDFQLVVVKTADYYY